MPNTVLNNEGPVGSDINDSRYSGCNALIDLCKVNIFYKMSARFMLYRTFRGPAAN